MDKREDFVKVSSPKVRYSDQYIEADYEYLNTVVKSEWGKLEVCPTQQQLKIKTARHVGRVGVMLVGWGGNNGSTFTAAVIANRNHYTWHTKTGLRSSNWYGSITQASTVRLGVDPEGKEVYIPMSQMLPMVHPDDLYVDGWDISRANLAESMVRAQVIDYDLQQQVRKEMLSMRPRPSIYNPDFIAANQSDRATNVIEGSKLEQYEQIRRDIREFKTNNNLDKVIVLWTANTERFCDVSHDIHGTPENLMKALANDEDELSPSTIFAMASIAEKCCYINGSPQNTFVPGVVEMAIKNSVFIGGDDFKSGQTKLKSVLVDFLVTAGIKPTSIVSYNHLGNNDGKNLSAPKQFRSKEISKSNVVDDMVASNSILYAENEKPDHVVVIKYVPYVGDSKRAMDEYTSEILLGGLNTIAVHNTCEDSLLAVPIILDLVILTELFTRITLSDDKHEQYCGFHSILTPLSYLLKAPLVPEGTPVVNALFKQRACIENVMRACIGLAPESNMLLEHKVPFMMAEMHAKSIEDILAKSLTQPPLKKAKKIQNGNANGMEIVNKE